MPGIRRRGGSHSATGVATVQPFRVQARPGACGPTPISTGALAVPRLPVFLAVASSIFALSDRTVRGEPAAPATAIRVGRLFDGTGDAFREDQVIVIEGERIKG